MTLLIRMQTGAANELLEEAAHSSGAQALLEQLNQETRDYLSQLGIDAVNPGALLDLRPGAVLQLLADLFRTQWQTPFRAAVMLCGLLLLVAVALAFLRKEAKEAQLLQTVGAACILISCTACAGIVLRDGAAAIAACAAFEKLLIPVCAALLTAGGHPATALSVQGAALLGAQALEAFAADGVLPLIAALGSFSLLDLLLPGQQLAKAVETARKTLLHLFSAAAGLFAGFLAIKGVVASAADAVTVRGVKLAGSFVPVVGSAVGEAYTVAVGCFALLKNTVGMLGILILFLLCLPVMLRLLIWILLLRGCGFFGRLIDAGACAALPDCIADLFSVLNSLLLLSLMLCVISAGLTVVLGRGG